MKISMPRPPHRLERLRAWMDDESLDCTCVFGTDNVKHLCGYWRYIGGVSALVVGRDGERNLVVMLDEARIARELSFADAVIGFGERGFGIDLDPVAGLIEVVASVPVVARAARIGISSELPGADSRLLHAVTAEPVDAGGILHRLRLVKDDDELEKILVPYQLCWLGHRAIAEAAKPGVQEIELYTAAQSAAQVASGGPIEFVCDLLSGPNGADVCCPIHVPVGEPSRPVTRSLPTSSSGRTDTGETRPRRTLPARMQRPRPCAKSCSGSSRPLAPSSCPEYREPRSSVPCRSASCRRSRAASSPTTAATRSVLPGSRTLT